MILPGGKRRQHCYSLTLNHTIHSFTGILSEQTTDHTSRETDEHRAQGVVMRSYLVAGSAWARTVAVVVTVFTSLTLADVEFTAPASGANITAGQIDVQWEESGISPLISELTQYTLSLMVGGNNLNDMVRSPLADLDAASKLIPSVATCCHFQIGRQLR